MFDFVEVLGVCDDFLFWIVFFVEVDVVDFFEIGYLWYKFFFGS